jgi:hypothetical protein
MSTDKLKQMVWIGIIIVNIGIWYSIITNGLLTTLLWLVIISCIGGIVIKIKENKYI